MACADYGGEGRRGEVLEDGMEGLVRQLCTGHGRQRCIAIDGMSTNGPGDGVAGRKRAGRGGGERVRRACRA